MKTPFSTLSEEEIQFFLTYKESQYAIRKKRIEDFCSIQDENFGRKIIKNSLVYDKGSLKYVLFRYLNIYLLQRHRIHRIFFSINDISKATEDDKISYCQIAKVASSTWCNHFIKLGEVRWLNNEEKLDDNKLFSAANVTDKERYRWRDALQIFAPKLWPQPSKVRIAGTLWTLIRYDRPVTEPSRRVAWRADLVHCNSPTSTLKIGQCLLSEVCRAVNPQVLGKGRSQQNKQRNKNISPNNWEVKLR